MFGFHSKSSEQIPVFDIAGNQPGKTVLITAGVDGDEYAGIHAAYQLEENYRHGNFSGRLVIIPIVNVERFKQECSQNPLDGKLPKNIFPGSPDGSPSEQRIH